LVKTKKEQTLAGEVVAFFFSVSSKRPIEKANVFLLFFLLHQGTFEHGNLFSVFWPRLKGTSEHGDTKNVKMIAFFALFKKKKNITCPH
jgi:hypothetical protein